MSFVNIGFNKGKPGLFPAGLLTAPDMLLFIINLDERNMKSLGKAILQYK